MYFIHLLCAINLAQRVNRVINSLIIEHLAVEINMLFQMLSHFQTIYAKETNSLG
jgi:hypothetical protein